MKLDRGSHRVFAVAILVGIGIAGLVLPVYDLLTTGVTQPLDTIGVTASVVLVGLLWAVVYRLCEYEPRGDNLLFVAAWSLSIAAVAFSITALAILSQEYGGGTIVAPWLLLNDITLVGSLIGLVVGYFHIETRRKALAIEEDREEIAEQQRRLLFTNRLLRHDVRNDVAVIQGYATLLEERHPDTDELATIRRKSERIDQLIDVARQLTETTTGADREPVDAGTALQNALEQVRDSFPGAAVDLTTDRPDGVRVLANDLLATVFQNVLRNAIEHNDRETPRVQVSTESLDDRLRVRIADDGPGIPESLKHTLFQAGEQGEHSTGVGLGLYLVETLIAKYEGDVWIEDNEPTGSIFVLELPRVDG